MTTTANIQPTPSDTPAPPRLKPRRTLNRLAQAGAGLLLAAAGQALFAQGEVGLGAVLYLLAAIVFGRAVSHHLYPDYRLTIANPRTADRLAIHSGWRRNVGLWFILIAVGLSAFGYTAFAVEETRVQGWWLYLASLGAMLAGGVLLTPGFPLPAELRRMFPHRHILIAFGVILAIAAFMRLYHFSGQPFGIWFDEAEAGLQARQILADAQYRPIFYPGINVTGQFLAIYAAALYWLGDNIHSLRLVSVLFGLAGVVAAFLFGQELRGPRFGLALAFFMAVARWPVNFSRIAMTGIDAPFFIFLSLYFLTRLLRRGHLRDAMWAGLTIGLGLIFYTAFRLYLAAIVIFAGLAAIRWAATLWPTIRERGWLRYLGAMTLLLVTGWLVVMPTVKFAVDHPEAFWYRTRQISILTKRDQADLVTALGESGQKHLQMFNISGDKNGRHNLPGEPMLDPLLGMLFILGLGLALSRTRHPANLFFLILLPTALIGGIFSVDFEAPQSLRSIAVIPAVVYFCALAAAALGREAEASLSPLPRRWVIGPALAGMAAIFWFNATTYFIRQANDFASWNAFSAPETITGTKMAELGPDYTYILSPFLANHPTTYFLAPDITTQKILALPDALPIRDPANRPVAMFLHPDDSWVFEQAKRLYPNATFEALSGPPDPGSNDPGPPSVYAVVLQPDDLLAVRGLELRYTSPVTETESMPLLAPLASARAYHINVIWPDDAPPGDDFVAEWRGVLYIPHYGPYGFRLVSPAQSMLEIDGNTVLTGTGEQLAGLTLAQGNHSLRVQAHKGTGQVALYWQPSGAMEELVPDWALYVPPVTNHGLLGTFYPNANWEGQPAFQRIDPYLDTYYHLIPLQRPYTVEWTGSLLAPQSGIYTLGLRAVQEANLALDDQPLLTTAAPNQLASAVITLEAGLHQIRVRYKDTVDRSRIHLTWSTPTGISGPIPTEYLWPPLGAYPTPDQPVAAPTTDAAATAPITLRHLTSFGAPGKEPGQFLEPRDVTVLANGNVLVADTLNRRVQVFSPDFQPVAQLTGSVEFPFEEPLAVDVLRQEGVEQILVLDSTLQWIYRFSAEGNFVDRFGGPEIQFFHPRGLNVDDGGVITVADTGKSRLVLFKADGSQMGIVGGGPGRSPGQFNEPVDAVKDSYATWFVTEAENDRVQRLDAAGNSLYEWPIPPAYAYNGPHLALLPAGSLLMTEAQSRLLLHFSAAGELLGQWSGVEGVQWQQPVGLYVDSARHRLYLTDTGSQQVHVFEIGP